MSAPLFDPCRRDLHRQRAVRLGGDRFLHRRALEDIVDRLAARGLDATTALLVGPLDPAPLAQLAAAITHAATLGQVEAAPGSLDLIILLGELEASNDLAATMLALRYQLSPGGTLAGCVVGGASLPRLRAALLEADRALGRAAPRVHPMLDGSSLSALLQSAGYDHPVVAVDRVQVTYPALDRLVADLRVSGCTAALTAQAPPLTRGQLDIARGAFMGGERRVTERFELIHFTASAPGEVVRQLQH